MSCPSGGVVERRLDIAALRAQILRQTSLVERAPQIGHLHWWQNIGDVVGFAAGSLKSAP